MSSIIGEIFVEDHVQQVSTSIKETLRDLYLLRHARDFKFYKSQAQWRVKILAFYKKCFLLLRLCFNFFVFPREQSIYEIFEVFLSLRSHYGHKLHFYFYSFLRSYAFQSNATFIRILSFISVFTILCMMWPSNFESRMQQM